MPIPDGQEWLIKRMQALGFTSYSDGVCCGIAHMGMQAILANDLESFDLRMEMLADIAVEHISNAIAKLKLKITPPALSEDDKLLLDTPAFFNGIELYQNSKVYAYLFPPNMFGKLKSQNAAPLLSYLNPVSLDLPSKQNSISEIDAFSGAYNQKDLEVYFNLLKQATNHSALTAGLVLKSANHAITVSYDHVLQKWLCIDADQLPSAYFDQAEHIAAAVMCSLGNDKVAIFSTRTYCKTLDANKAEEFIHYRNSLNEWKTLRTPSNRTMLYRDDEHASWLSTAAREGLLDEVKLLLSKTNFWPHFKPDLSPLSLATGSEEVEIVTALLRHPSFNPNLVYKMKALFLHVIESKNIALVKAYLNSLTLNVNGYATTGKKPLFLAIELGESEIVKAILQHPHINVNDYNESNETLLMFAVRCNNLDAVTALLTHKHIDPNHSDYLSSSRPLNVAISLGYENIVEALLKHHKINPNFKTNGRTALHFAIASNNLLLVRKLLDRGADVSQRTDFGESPLFVAILFNNVSIVAELLQRNADYIMPLTKTPTELRQLAQYFNFSDKMEQFIEAKFKIKKTATISITPQELAMILKYSEISQLLVAKHIHDRNSLFSPAAFNLFPKVDVKTTAASDSARKLTKF